MKTNHKERVMKNHMFFTLISLFLSIILLNSCTQEQSSIRENLKPCFRATEGDTVWVIINHVKTDKREQFENLIHDITWPTISKADSITQKVENYTRVLHPTKINNDSTYTFIFIGDPVIKGANYNFSYLLRNVYEQEEADEYLKKIQDCFSSPQTFYTQIQSQH